MSPASRRRQHGVGVSRRRHGVHTCTESCSPDAGENEWMTRARCSRAETIRDVFAGEEIRARACPFACVRACVQQRCAALMMRPPGTVVERRLTGTAKGADESAGRSTEPQVGETGEGGSIGLVLGGERFRPLANLDDVHRNEVYSDTIIAT